ncbi:MAG TPA: hypothetical protein VEA60_05310 [Allosphingosinicella sp.]|nr:hypothetical protein [Allosphingosinicella sp.]
MTSTTDERPAGASATNKGAESGSGESRVPAARQAYESARERTAAAYAAARERAGTAYGSAGRRAGEGIDANPVAAVVGGLAIGAIVAAMLPRTRREDALLGTAGRRLNESAREAARAAREAGKDQLDELGLSKDGLRSKLDEFTGRAVGALRDSAGAAAGAARGKGKD